MKKSYSVEEAQRIILEHVSPLSAQDENLTNAFGRTIAEDVYAAINVPGKDCSSMDGFAVRPIDIKNASLEFPVYLTVIGSLMAGQKMTKYVVQGTAVRIMTGALLPQGADCVVRFEETGENKKYTQNNQTEIGKGREDKRTAGVNIGKINAEKVATEDIIGKSAIEGKVGAFSAQQAVRKSSIKATVEIFVAKEAGENVRKAGEQIAKGQILATKGEIIGPAEVGLLASVGFTHVKVYRRPRVAILATGEELVWPGKSLMEGKIYCGNSMALAGQIRRFGGIPVILGIARDNTRVLKAKLEKARECDFIISSGGVSGGDKDLVKSVLAEIGKIYFERVEMQPGKSVAFGELGSTPYLALAGNPPASMIGCQILARPAILKLQGRKDCLQSTFKAILTDELKNSGSMQRFVWVELQNRGSCVYASDARLKVQGALVSIAYSNGLAILPYSCCKLEKGQEVSVIPLDWN